MDIESIGAYIFIVYFYPPIIIIRSFTKWQGWNPYSRFLDIGKVDLILRKRIDKKNHL